MSFHTPPMAERIHIGIFGKRNAGKSSIINAITGQNLAIVSDIKGTTTDPVQKSMELLPLGPVVVIDTPGLDDDGSLGALRVKKSYQTLNKTDIALLVVDACTGFTSEDSDILAKIREKRIPYVVALNKSDLTDNPISLSEREILVSAKTGYHIRELKELLAAQIPQASDKILIGDLVSPSDVVILVIPVDKAAPKGRLILPQQQTIRDLLDHNAISMMVKEDRLAETLALLKQKPALVITDSQAFATVSHIVPEDILLTSFSILFARYKGELNEQVAGASVLDDLQDEDTILICEGCTHHRQCGDIGTEKLPAWITRHSGKNLSFAFTSGTEFPDELSGYRLIIHCGGCMLNDREMKYRIQCAKDARIPITNYGTAIAHMNGILERSLKVFQ